MNDLKAEDGFCGMPWKNGLGFLISSYGKRLCQAKRVTWTRNGGRTDRACLRKNRPFDKEYL